MGKESKTDKSARPFDGELYDRRLQVYLAVHELLEGVTSQGKVNGEAMAIFEREKLHGEFLFGEKVSEYLDELKSMAGKNLASNTILEHLDDPEQTEKYAKDADKSLEWLVKQKEKIKGVFAKDMSIT